MGKCLPPGQRGPGFFQRSPKFWWKKKAGTDRGSREREYRKIKLPGGVKGDFLRKIPIDKRFVMAGV